MIRVHCINLTYSYFRVYPYLCNAVRNFAKDWGKVDVKKDFYVSFKDVPSRSKVRELTANKMGTLLKISGQVIHRRDEIMRR